jgi:hypothetical protein
MIEYEFKGVKVEIHVKEKDGGYGGHWMCTICGHVQRSEDIHPTAKRAEIAMKTEANPHQGLDHG